MIGMQGRTAHERGHAIEQLVVDAAKAYTLVDMNVGVYFGKHTKHTLRKLPRAKRETMSTDSMHAAEIDIILRKERTWLPDYTIWVAVASSQSPVTLEKVKSDIEKLDRTKKNLHGCLQKMVVVTADAKDMLQGFNCMHPVMYERTFEKYQEKGALQISGKQQHMIGTVIARDHPLPFKSDFRLVARVFPHMVEDFRREYGQVVLLANPKKFVYVVQPDFTAPAAEYLEKRNIPCYSLKVWAQHNKSGQKKITRALNKLAYA